MEESEEITRALLAITHTLTYILVVTAASIQELCTRNSASKGISCSGMWVPKTRRYALSEVVSYKQCRMAESRNASGVLVPPSGLGQAQRSILILYNS